MSFELFCEAAEYGEGGDVTSSVDVVVPCFRYGHFLRQCVESVLSQAGVDVRVLIIDDASPDNTAEVAAALASGDPRVHFVRHTENKSHIVTYNEGLLEWASADYSLLLSADDYLLPGALERATRLMGEHPHVGLTFGNVVELSDSANETRISSIVEPKDGSARRILRGQEFIELSGADNLVATCTAVVRTELQKRVGGYRKELPHAGDMEMWLRFAVHGSVGFIAAFQGAYRQHKGNMSRSYYYIVDGDVIYTKNGRLADLYHRKAAIESFRHYCDVVAPGLSQLGHKLNRRLSQVALSRASAAFNEGLIAESRQLSDFALEVWPGVRRSPAWARLTCKRLVGARAWRVVGPAVAAVRINPRT